MALRRLVFYVMAATAAAVLAIVLTHTGSPGATTTSYPSLNQIDFDGDHDAGCALTGSAEGAWDTNETNADYPPGGPPPTSTTIEHSIVGEGNCSARFFDAAGTRRRAELGHPVNGNNPEITYELLIYVPVGMTYGNKPPTLEGTTLTQTHAQSDPSLGHGCYGGGVSINGPPSDTLHLRTVRACTSPQEIGQSKYILGSFPKGQWFAVKVRESFADDATGYVQAWVDPDGPGPAIYQERLPKTFGDNAPVSPDSVFRVREGSYRGDSVNDTVLYEDGFHLKCWRPVNC
jgi:polysaccharide lyase-like protein